jgi:CheY-like chemotaxis protein
MGESKKSTVKANGHYREQFTLPALALLDLKLPCIVGMEVLRWIRQQHGTVHEWRK